MCTNSNFLNKKIKYKVKEILTEILKKSITLTSLEFLKIT